MALEFYSTNLGSGGAGAPIIQISTSSQSLLNASSANPILAPGGTIDFEAQIIDGTYIGIALLELGGLLLEGVIYRITDFNHGIGNGVILTTAQFMCIKNNGLPTRLSPRGVAHTSLFVIGGPVQYELSYDLQNDFIEELYYKEFNQRASRTLTGGSNNIETLPWQSVSCQNFRVVESIFLNLSVGAGNTISDSEILNTTVDWNLNAGFITSGSHLNECTINFFNTGSFEGCKVAPGCTLDINAPCVRSSWGTGCVQTVTVNSGLTDCRTGAGENTWNWNNATPVRVKRTFESALNEFQKFAPANAGSDTIADSFATYLFIHLHPDAAPPVLSYTLFLPAAPVPGQIVNIGADEAMAGVTINGNGNTVQSNVAVFAKNQGVSFYYNVADTTWYIVN